MPEVVSTELTTVTKLLDLFQRFSPGGFVMIGALQ